MNGGTDIPTILLVHQIRTQSHHCLPEDTVAPWLCRVSFKTHQAMHIGQLICINIVSACNPVRNAMPQLIWLRKSVKNYQ